MFLYVVAFAEPAKLPLFQGILTAMFLSGKIISCLLIAITMTSGTAQLIFFIFVGALSVVSALLLNCLL